MLAFVQRIGSLLDIVCGRALLFADPNTLVMLPTLESGNRARTSQASRGVVCQRSLASGALGA